MFRSGILPWLPLLLTVGLIVTACAPAATESGLTVTEAPSSEEDSPTTTIERPEPAADDPIVAMAISDGLVGFEASYAATRQVGIDSTSLSLAWDEIEVSPGVYAPEPDFAAIANAFYGAEGVSLNVTVSVLDTTEERLPADLAGRPLDDPEVIARFNGLMTWLAGRLTDVELTAVAIGNEVDIRLAATGQWAEYERFFASASAHARTVFPGVPIGVKTTLDGATGPFASEVAALHAEADVLLLTHYLIGDGFAVDPPDAVHDAFANALGLDPAKPVMFLELGYPTDPMLGGSEAGQAEFVTATFDTWDANAARVPVVQFTWSTDIGGDAVLAYYDYYGLSDERFGAYLASIGYLRPDGTAKPAYDQLATEIADRDQ